MVVHLGEVIGTMSGALQPHVMPDRKYIVVHLGEVIDTVSGALQSKPNATQRKWLMAPSVGEWVAAIVDTEMRGVSPDALASGLKLLVDRAARGGIYPADGGGLAAIPG